MLIFGSLLWIDNLNHSSINNKNKKIESYFKQLDVLAKSLKHEMNADLHVFTNNPDLINKWFLSTGRNCPVVLEISATYTVPDGTPFFGAHHKLEALDAGRKLLKNDEDRFLLLDADIFVIKKINKEQLEVMENSDLIVYDISSQVFPAYGFDRIKNDLEQVAGVKFDKPVWYGGEFICGSFLGFEKLIEEINKIYPKYIELIKKLHHVGDEMFVSAALNIISDSPGELIFVEQNNFNLVSRHWSRFSNPSVDWHLQHVFLHCPGSKPLLEFISSFSNPSKLPIKILLKTYSLAVRFYQWFKSFNKIK